MNKINYQLRLDEIIKRHEAAGETPTLLLHSCCAPCSSYTIEYLSQYFRITVLYYNPNISPESEYATRREEQRRLISEMETVNPVMFEADEYDPQTFYNAVRGLENEPEGGDRCLVCYRMRLERAARLAAERGMDYFTTTLTISPMKRADSINEIGEEIAARTGASCRPTSRSAGAIYAP